MSIFKKIFRFRTEENLDFETLAHEGISIDFYFKSDKPI